MIHRLEDLPPAPPPEGAVVTVGAFDGVHVGHRKILETVRVAAAHTGARPVLLTFHPHPREVLFREEAPLLTTPEERAALAAALGIDAVVLLAFTREVAAQTAEAFVDEVLRGRLGLKTLVVGHDHAFGANRSGNLETFRRLGAARGFAVERVEAALYEGEPVSSSRVRRALQAGAVAEAAAMLGRPYTLAGRIVEGERRGRVLGFPTANLQPEPAARLTPAPGVYAVECAWPGGRRWGMMNIGYRPTFDGRTLSREAHLFDFDGDLYGAPFTAAFHARIRSEERFASVEALTAQLRRDREVCISLASSLS